ncbi:MAG: type II toxin-antitoxin system RelE/ParE family toxin [Verrucomicrobia bacterium]|nr:type II toxin-antitoxin system RelE/ParE family toxin [Verrucomicrobiota bacterium]
MGQNNPENRRNKNLKTPSQGKIFDQTKFRNEADKIYAFKPQPDRYLCFFFRGKKIIVTNAFTKKTQKLPEGEKELAVKAYEEEN